MIAHTTLHVSDYGKSKAFYEMALAPLGYGNNMEEDEAAGFNDGKNTDFWIVRAEVIPTHLAFEARWIRFNWIRTLIGLGVTVAFMVALSLNTPLMAA